MPRRFPLLGKTFALGAVVVALFLGLQVVSGVVAEREGRLHEAERSVAASLASAQTLVGPILSRDCIESWESTQGEGKEKRTVIERADVRVSESPQSLGIKGNVAIEPRYRGIFRVNGYVLKAQLAARWDDGVGLQTPRAGHPGGRIECEAPVVFVALGDARGVRTATLRLDGAALPVQPGTTHAAHPRGFHVDVAPAYVGAKRPLAVEVDLEIVGTGELAIAPVGDSTSVELSSNWPHPSFGGRFLPVERQVGERGFSARWQLNALATSAPQSAANAAGVCGYEDAGGEGSQAEPRRGRCIETFGVSFIDPVSPYVLADRATKYGLLFIVLTFVAVGLVEVMRSLRVHPIQYLLVGSALVVFFLLLVSLSEHVSFGIAYVVAAGACSALLAFYGSFVLRGIRAGALLGAGIATLYGILYLLLQLEQTALLLGSLLLFAILAGVMVATRKIDWYALFNRGGAPAESPPGLGPAAQ